jgi:hypothetical protein
MKQALVCLIFVLWVISTTPDLENASQGLSGVSTSTLDIVFEDTEDLITRLSTERGFDVNVALKIADCESKTGKYKTNWQGSSAKGIYMFTDRTWENYCDGDVMDDYDNIRCFLNLYRKHPSWWACRA